MKRLLIALLAVAGFFAIAPDAEAHGYRERYVRYYDHCDRPVYGYIYRSYRPRVSYYRAPVRRYYRSDYGCYPPRRYYSSRPRFSFHIGF